jgi:hypothetical protein
VRGHQAVVWSRASNSGTEYVLGWTAGGWTRYVSVDPVGADSRRSITAELVRVAESMR